MFKKKAAPATAIPNGALNHNEGKHITKFEYVCIMLARRRKERADVPRTRSYARTTP